MFKNSLKFLIVMVISVMQMSCSKDDDSSENNQQENTFTYKENTVQITSIEITEKDNFKTEYLIRTNHDVIFFIYCQYKSNEYQNESHGNITYTVDSPLYLEQVAYPNFSVRGYMFDNTSFEHFRLIDGKVRVKFDNENTLKMEFDNLVVKELDTEEQFILNAFINLPTD